MRMISKFERKIAADRKSQDLGIVEVDLINTRKWRFEDQFRTRRLKFGTASKVRRGAGWGKPVHAGYEEYRAKSGVIAWNNGERVKALPHQGEREMARRIAK